MKNIEMTIQCPDCDGTGVYSGMAEGVGTALICCKCKGSGKYQYRYEYEEFIGRKERTDTKRVYLSGYGYKIGLGVINFSDVGTIDMDKEGVSYADFLLGKTPGHITALACPLLADQSACHDIKGFVNLCNDLNGGWVSSIIQCKFRPKASECWKRFNKAQVK